MDFQTSPLCEEAAVNLQVAPATVADMLEINANGGTRPDHVSGSEVVAVDATADSRHGQVPVAQHKLAENAPAVQHELTVSHLVVQDKLAKSASVVQDNLAESHPVLQDKLAESAPIVHVKFADSHPVVQDNLAESAPIVQDKLVDSPPVVQDKLAEGARTSTDVSKSGTPGDAGGGAAAPGGASVTVTQNWQRRSSSLEHRRQRLAHVDFAEAFGSGLEALLQRHAASLRMGIGSSMLVQALQSVVSLVSVTVLIAALLLRALSHTPSLGKLATGSLPAEKVPMTSEVIEPLDHQTDR